MIGARRERIERRNFMIGLFLPTMSGGWTVSHATNLATYRYEYLRDWPLLVNAGFSAAGKDFAARLCDWIFILSNRPTDFDEDFIFLGTFQIFGTPEQVVEKFMRLKRAGCDGVHLVFLDWMHDLKFFGE